MRNIIDLICASVFIVYHSSLSFKTTQNRIDISQDMRNVEINYFIKIYLKDCMVHMSKNMYCTSNTFNRVLHSGKKNVLFIERNTCMKCQLWTHGITNYKNENKNLIFKQIYF